MWVRAPPSALDSGPESLRTLALWGSGLSAPQRYATHRTKMCHSADSPSLALDYRYAKQVGTLTATERSLR
jgi:hypothetical protein